MSGLLPSSVLLASLPGSAGKAISGENDAVASDAKNPRLAPAAKEFEALFIQMMLKSMRSASFGRGAMDSSQSELYRDLYDQEVSLQMAGSSGFGIAEMLMRQLSPTQSPMRVPSPGSVSLGEPHAAAPGRSLRPVALPSPAAAVANGAQSNTGR